MEAVTNATVLILLAKIDRLDLLNIIKKIQTTPEIEKEVLEGKEISVQEKERLEIFLKNMGIEKATTILQLDIGEVEKSALTLCKQKDILFFLSDDKKARRVANILGIKTLGTIGILLKNLQEKKITKKEAKEILHLLMTHSYYISTELYMRTVEIIDSA